MSFYFAVSKVELFDKTNTWEYFHTAKMLMLLPVDYCVFISNKCVHCGK